MCLDPPLQTEVLTGHSASLLAELLEPAPHRAQPGLLQFKIGTAQEDGISPNDPSGPSHRHRQGQMEKVRVGGVDLNLPPENPVQQLNRQENPDQANAQQFAVERHREITQMARQGPLHALQPGQQRHRIPGQQPTTRGWPEKRTGIVVASPIRGLANVDRQGNSETVLGIGCIRLIKVVIGFPIAIGPCRGISLVGERGHRGHGGRLHPLESPVHPSCGGEGGEQVHQILSADPIVLVFRIEKDSVAILGIRSRGWVRWVRNTETEPITPSQPTRLDGKSQTELNRVLLIVDGGWRFGIARRVGGL